MSPANIDVVVPAAGIGSRMQSHLPKQYLKLADSCILEKTLQVLLNNPNVARIVVSLHPQDQYFSDLAIAQNSRIKTVIGGELRVDSVLAGLKEVNTSWAVVHDAARPCLLQDDFNRLLKLGMAHSVGAILGHQVVDTMKRCNEQGEIIKTVSRHLLWHALTPQIFRTHELIAAIEHAQNHQFEITDEASAMELSGYMPLMVTGSSSNIKVTRPEDLKQAEEFLTLS